MIDDILQAHEDFNIWFAHAEPGESWSYYRGFLMADREYRHLHPDLRSIPIATDDLARTVYELETKGSIFLTQDRVGFCDYEYIATKSTPKSKRKRGNPRGKLPPKSIR